MVLRTARQQVILAGVIFVFAAALLHMYARAPEPAYTATDETSDLAIVDGIARADRATSTADSIRAVVVPHHLVAAEAIALGIKALASDKPRFVVVVSPDHFARCPTLICTSAGKYETFFGDVPISGIAVKKVLSHTSIASASELFIREHGIYAITPFIKHYLPDAQIVPIVISQKGTGTPQTRGELSVLVEELVGTEGVLVISSDFSHYLPQKESDAMDRKTEAAFCSGESEKMLSLDNPSQSDCPICLWLLHQEAIVGGFWNPDQIWHSNSATILHDDSVRETTSHFTFALGEKPAGSCRH